MTTPSPCAERCPLVAYFTTELARRDGVDEAVIRLRAGLPHPEGPEPKE